MQAPIQYDDKGGGLDKWIVLLALLGVIALGALLYNDAWMTRFFSTRTGKGEPIGEVLNAKNDVRRRMDQSLTWYPASVREKLYERDAIFTGHESETDLLIGQDNRLSLQPDSLVILQMQNNETIFDLQLGTVTTLVAATPTLKIIHEGQVAEIKTSGPRGAVTFSKDKGGKLSITSAKENIEVEIGGRKNKIKKNEQLNVDKAMKVSSQTFSAHITSHKIYEAAWVKPGDSVAFTWENYEPNTALKIQVSKTGKFDKTDLRDGDLLVDEPVTKNNYYFKPQRAQSYAYRLTKAKTGEVASLTHTLDIYSAQPIVLVSPTQNSVVNRDEKLAKGKDQPVQFQWQGKRGVNEFALHVARDENFTERVQGKTEAGNNLILSLPAGIYFWRVGAHKPDNRNLLSPTYRFRVGEAAWPVVPPRWHGPERPPTLFKADSAPVNQAQEKDVVLQFDETVDARSPASIEKNVVNPPRMQWRPMPDSESYKIEIDRSKDFKSPIVFSGIKKPEFTWRAVQPGQFHWRVKAVNSEGVESLPSAPNTVMVKLPPPVLVAQKLSDEKTNDANEVDKPKTVQLSWSAIPLAKQYAVKVNDEVRMVSSEQTTLDVKPNVPTRVFVAAANSKGTPMSEFREHTFQFERRLMLKTPHLKMPSDNMTLIAFDANHVDPIVFIWKEIAGTKYYVLQFASDGAFKNILAEKRASQNRFILKDRLSSGTIYWRVRAHTDSTYSEWSAPRQYEMQVAKPR